MAHFFRFLMAFFGTLGLVGCGVMGPPVAYTSLQKKEAAAPPPSPEKAPVQKDTKK
jgi:mannose/fructose/N-acetylgalactosamine-specific phosphotransferase system component IIC